MCKCSIFILFSEDFTFYLTHSTNLLQQTRRCWRRTRPWVLFLAHKNIRCGIIFWLYWYNLRGINSMTFQGLSSKSTFGDLIWILVCTSGMWYFIRVFASQVVWTPVVLLNTFCQINPAGLLWVISMAGKPDFHRLWGQYHTKSTAKVWKSTISNITFWEAIKDTVFTLYSTYGQFTLTSTVFTKGLISALSQYLNTMREYTLLLWCLIYCTLQVKILSINMFFDKMTMFYVNIIFPICYGALKASDHHVTTLFFFFTILIISWIFCRILVLQCNFKWTYVQICSLRMGVVIMPS